MCTQLSHRCDKRGDSATHSHKSSAHAHTQYTLMYGYVFMNKSEKEEPRGRQCYRRPQSNSGQWRKTQFPLHIKTICLTDCWILIGLYFMIILTCAVYVWVFVVPLQCSWHHFVAKCVNKVACALTFICVINPHETKCAPKHSTTLQRGTTRNAGNLTRQKHTKFLDYWTIFLWIVFFFQFFMHRSGFSTKSDHLDLVRYLTAQIGVLCERNRQSADQLGLRRTLVSKCYITSCLNFRVHA